MQTPSVSLSTAPRLPAGVVLALAACYVIWGSTYLAIRVALVSLPPFFQMGSRFLVAGALLALWVLWRKRSAGVASVLPTAVQWRNALVVGTLMLGGGMGLIATASVNIGSGLIATCVAVVPMMITGWGLLWGRRPGRLDLAGMGIGALGVLLLVRGESFSASPASIACALASTACWSLGSVLSTTRMPLAPGPIGFASEMLCGGAVLLAISLGIGEQPAWPPQPAAITAWLYLVVFGSLIGFSAYLYLLARASPALASSYAFVNPAVALALGSMAAGEAVTAQEGGACAVILLAVAMILAQNRRSRG
ncbi:EamA family transporter [Paracidovorax konjaci]|uniref:Threonine/homoserine efflux transporter RhtA n=1 Tax=Paracidovorax konjaci TaxID=32040 RepID=A0A1I1T665_9BURK|nr:EamA family transporter [Paracidovorax konjaci]SFD54105.1 Threonine/homoserine efflux transporter RhtA [Paracidovorax konjaci]